MSFVKDARGVIINTDDSEYRAVLAQRNYEKKARETSQEVNDLKQELAEIKTLLAQVINRN